MKLVRGLAAWLLLQVGLPGVGWATIDAYQFEVPEQEAQFRKLITELRCPKCQNQNISDSNAGLAKDIKDRVYKLVLEGKTNQEITAYMVERYGDFITYRPPVRRDTWFLWFGPFVVVGLAALVLFIRFKTRESGDPAARPLSEAEQKKVEALMKTLEDGDQTDK